LPISQQFVRLMGGEITVSSILGTGTTFKFDIPVRLATELIETPPKSQIIGLAPEQSSYRILVVDDRWQNRQLIVKLLAPLGFQLQEAANGQEAIEIWQEWLPHLILMDMRMPVMDGYAASRYIKSQVKSESKSPVIIAVTASALAEEKAVVMAAGCDQLMPKPFRSETLLGLIEDYLDVKYIYNDHANNLPNCHDQDYKNFESRPLTPEAIGEIMSGDWIVNLHVAASSGDDEDVRCLIAQIPETHANIATDLIHLTNNFQFQQIMDLCTLV